MAILIYNNPADDKLLTRKEAADVMQVSVQTIHNWAGRGYLPSVRYGARRMFRESDCLRIKNENRK